MKGGGGGIDLSWSSEGWKNWRNVWFNENEIIIVMICVYNISSMCYQV